MKADEKTEIDVVKTLNALMAAYRDRDIERVMGFFAPDSDVTALGTNLDQFVMGTERIREAYQDDFEAFDRLEMEVTHSQVSAEGSVAWLCAQCAAAFEIEGEKIRSNARLTAVLVRRQSAWRIIQFHLSFPADQQTTDAPSHRL